AGAELHRRVTKGDGVGALSAASAEDEPAQDGNVVVGCDGGIASRASGSGCDHGEPAGHTMDDDVEETADGQSDQKSSDGEERLRVRIVEGHVECATIIAAWRA